MPVAQLPCVPSTRRPAGSAAVLISAWPAAGPPMANGVSAVKRRAYRDGRTICQRPSLSSTSITETPCAAWLLATFSAVHGCMPPACSRPSSVYSWFVTSRPRRLPSSGEKCMPSWCMPSLHRLLGGAVGRVGRPRRHVAGDAHRLAPGCQHAGRVARGHDHGVGHGGGMPLKPSRRRGAGRAGRPTQPASGAKKGRRGQAEAAAQHGAPRGVGDLVDGGVGGAVAVLHGREVLGHAVVPAGSRR